MRTFFALGLSPRVQQQVSLIIDNLAKQVPLDVIRWVRLQNLHLTVQFLGQIDRAKIENIQTAVMREVPDLGPALLQITKPGVFPNLKKPAVIWLGVQDHNNWLQSVYQMVAAASSVHGVDPDPRGFFPHLTLGRVRKQAAMESRHQVGMSLKQAFNTGRFSRLEWFVSELLLYKSELRPDGPVYTRLGEYKFKE